MRHLSQETSLSVVGVCRNAVSAGPIQADGLDVRIGSIVDPMSADELLGDCTVVVNCAVDVDWPGTARHRTRRLLASIASLARLQTFVFFSTVAVYGTCLDRSASTAERPRPRNMHGWEKLAAEQYIRSVAPSHVRLRLLRLGHVYGPYQWLSRAMFELIARPVRTLPFDGRHPSNAIHIQNVCRAVVAAIGGDGDRATYDVVDRPQRTWREVADWHARALNATPVAAMPEVTSAAIARRYRRLEHAPLWLRLISDFGAFAKSMPVSFARSSDAAQLIAQRALARLEAEGLEQRLKARYYLARARANADGLEVPPPWLFSDEVPGPVLEYEAKSPDDTDGAAVAEWYRAYASPERLFGASP